MSASASLVGAAAALVGLHACVHAWTSLQRGGERPAWWKPRRWGVGPAVMYESVGASTQLAVASRLAHGESDRSTRHPNTRAEASGLAVVKILTTTAVKLYTRDSTKRIVLCTS